MAFLANHSVLLAMLSAALFGAAAPASKWLLLGLTPIQLAGLLYLGAALAVMPISFQKGSSPLPLMHDRPNKLRLLGAILFGGVLGPIFLMFGLSLSQAGSVSLLLNLELVATAIIGVFFFRDHLSISGWAGIATALLAATLLTFSRVGFVWLGSVLALLACLMWGIDNHLTATIDGITPSQSTFWKGLVAGLVNLSIGIMLDPFVWDTTIIVSALFVGALSYGASIVLYIKSAQGMGATRSQVIFSSAPFFGLLLSVVWLGEELTGTHILASGLFIIAIILLMLDSHAHSHIHKKLAHKHSHRHDDNHHNHSHIGLDKSVRHTHYHEHEALEHEHPHWPDLHHRHDHKNKL
tara:strand:- start:320 stop:1375 length:1056 start_codon:yes stop_codon:yes gene_type:complete